MELDDAERECRNDAADHEAERWEVHTAASGKDAWDIDYAQDSEDGPFVYVWTNMAGFSATEACHVDEFIAALTAAREYVFGPKEES